MWGVAPGSNGRGSGDQIQGSRARTTLGWLVGLSSFTLWMIRRACCTVRRRDAHRAAIGLRMPDRGPQLGPTSLPSPLEPQPINRRACPRNRCLLRGRSSYRWRIHQPGGGCDYGLPRPEAS